MSVQVQDNCTVKKCPYKHGCRNIPVLLSEEKKKIDILFIQSMPLREEAAKVQYMYGKDSLLRNIIRHISKTLDFTYATTSLIRVPIKLSKKQDIADKKNIGVCLENLERVIEKTNPKVIVGLGIDVYRALSGKLNSEIHLERSAIHNIDVNGREFPIISTVSLQSALEFRLDYYPGLIYRDVWKAVQLANYDNDFRIPNKAESVVIKTLKDVRNILAKMKKEKRFVAQDTETETLGRVYGNRLLSIQMCNDGKIGYVIPFDHMDSPFSARDRGEIIELYRDFMLDPDVEMLGHTFCNANFDLHQFMRHTHILVPNRPVLDIIKGERALDENQMRWGLGLPKGYFPISLKMLSYKRGFTGYMDNEKMDKDMRTSLAFRPLVDWKDYAGADGVTTFNIFKSQRKEAKALGYDNFMNLMKHVNSPSNILTTYVEHCGMPISMDAVSGLLDKKNSPFYKELRQINSEASLLPNVQTVVSQILKETTGTSRTLFGIPRLFSFGKMDHKRRLFWDTMNLEPISRNKEKESGTEGEGKLDKEFVKAYKDFDEVKLFGDYVRIRQLLGLFIKTIGEMLTPGAKKANVDCFTDQRIRAQYDTSTVTARLSCRNPNLQQRVSRGKGTEHVLSMFHSKPNRVLIKLDFKVHEVRGLQIISGDTTLRNNFLSIADNQKRMRSNPDKYWADLEASINVKSLSAENQTLWKEDRKGFLKKVFKAFTDVHIQNAAQFFETDILGVTEDQRDQSKRLIFGVTYGMADQSLAERLGCSLKEAVKIKEIMYQKMVQGGEWLDRMQVEAKEHLFLENPTFRRRHLWGYLFPEKDFRGIHGTMSRFARNNGIQSMCSDFAIMGGYLLLNWIWENELGKYQVPDEDAWMLINLVHDSAEAEVPVNDVVRYLQTSEPFFTSNLTKYVHKNLGLTMEVPFEVDYEVGLTFANTKKWDGTLRQAKEIQDWVLEENLKICKAAGIKPLALPNLKKAA